MNSSSIPDARDFFEASKEIVKSFLQSVVVIDDLATFDGSRPNEKEAHSLVVPVEPGRRENKNEAYKDTERDTSLAKENSEQPEVRPEEIEILNVKQLADRFADIGLVCGILKPTKDELSETIVKADHIARRADIVIFDWRLFGEEKEGETALSSILSILNRDESESNDSNTLSRVRLIAIYTSIPELTDIVNKTQSFLQANELSFEKLPDDSFSLVNNGAKIVFYKKSGGLKPLPEIIDRTVSEKNLVDKLVADFTKMTFGLLSNSALNSLDALRNNTHRILRKFEQNLDAPYLTHRTMVTPVDEAEQHLVPLLTSEFHDILEDCGVDQNVSLETITNWINYQISTGKILLDGKDFDMSPDELKQALLNLIKNGINFEIKYLKDNSKFPKWRKKLDTISKGDTESFITTLLTIDKSGSKQDLDFAILTIMRSQYKKPDPIMSLGTIVSQTNNGEDEYYICIQPVCDSVRLKEDTVFPFLKLTVSNTQFDIVINDRDEHKKLKISLKPRDISLFTLKQEDSEVRAKKHSPDEYVFEAIGTESNIRWIGNLKFAHAQKMANDFAREISRVGLTESDWLRRLRPKP